MGSRQWVGAVELSYVLDQLLGVTSKILNLSRGSELPSRAREIAHHFDTQGVLDIRPPRARQCPLSQACKHDRRRGAALLAPSQMGCRANCQ